MEAFSMDSENLEFRLQFKKFLRKVLIRKINFIQEKWIEYKKKSIEK